MTYQKYRPKIALVVPSLSEDGGVPAVARFIKDIILRSGRYDLQLVSLSTSSRDPFSLIFSLPRTWLRGATTSSGVWDGLPFLHVGAVGGEFEFRRYQPRKVLADAVADCDIIQVVCGSPTWANTVCGMGKPVAVHCATRVRVERRLRDSQPRNLGDWWRKAMTEITDRLDDRALRMVDAVQVMNPWMLDYVRQLNGGRSLDLRYAPPGIDAKVFHPLSKRDISSDPYILCVARLSDPRKNIGLILDAYAQLPSHLVNRVRLVLAGSSAPPDSFWTRVDELGLGARVTYFAKPSQQALVSLYQRAAVFVLPSDEEGFGMVLIEAMACGVPVVSTLSGGPDGILTGGQDGYLVPLDNAVVLAQRISQLCTDLALNVAMGQRARKTVEQRYADDVAGRAFVDVWDQLLKKTGKR